MAQAEKRCATCRLHDAEYFGFTAESDPEEAIGLCRWPSEFLPYSLRYGARERMAVAPNDGTFCHQWIVKDAQ